MFPSILLFIFFSLSSIHASNEFEGKFLICYDKVANRSYGYEIDDQRFSSGYRRVCTSSMEKVNGEWSNVRLLSSIIHRNTSLSSCSSSLIRLSCTSHDCNRQWDSISSLLSFCQSVNSILPSPQTPFYPHYEKSIECFNSTLGTIEKLVNLDPRKAEICMAQATFHNDQWTFIAGPRTIWRSLVPSMNRCDSSFLRLICLHSNCNSDLVSTPSIINRCSLLPHPHPSPSPSLCPDCTQSMNESFPLSHLILPPLIHNGSDWMWKERRSKIVPPSIQFSIEGGDGMKTRKPSLYTAWSREGRTTTTTTHTPLFIHRPDKGKEGRRIGHLSTITVISLYTSTPSVVSTQTTSRYSQDKEGKELIGMNERKKESETKTNVSATIREVWTSPLSGRLLTEKDEKKGDKKRTTQSNIEDRIEPRIRAVLSPIDTRDELPYDEYDNEEGRKEMKREEEVMKQEKKEQKEKGINERDEEEDEVKDVRVEKEDGDDELQMESKEMSAVRRERIEGASIYASPSHDTIHTHNDINHPSRIPPEVIHNLKILRMGIIAGFVTLSIIILLFIMLLTLMGRRLNSSTSRDHLLPSDSNRNVLLRY